MLFYKIEVALQEKSEILERSERTNRAAAMQSKIDLFLERQNRDCHITVSSIFDAKQKSVLCAAVTSGILAEKMISEFLDEIDLNSTGFTIQEITLESYFGLLRTASRNDFISDDDDVTDKLHISDLNKRFNRADIRYSETIIPATEKRKALSEQAKTLLCDTSLTAELERIFQCPNAQEVSGHPVHYLLQSEGHESRNKMLKILLSALYQNKRITSRRYCEVCFAGYDTVDEAAIDLLYESCSGGTVVVSFGEDDQRDGEYARVGADVVARLCGAMRKARNNVLTIFCLPKASSKAKEAFLEHLGAVTVVSICEEAAFDERARSYLRGLAKSHGVRGDRELYRPVADGRGYSSANLRLIFDEWYDRRLKTKVYAQYADLETANRQIALKKPKGSAIEELSDMIGLREAKTVIRQALDFYKAKKLFREKGFSVDRPAMHMLFTGNPGTAKTTVARLFAQIMKDNDLLSTGELYEVGRADLVGKYVGWTAQIVKQKFKAAKGSVLFIDEAYSLVDDKDGLFGDEAINTIVQEMENYREDMIVIFAGYPDKMEGFLEKNPGLRSRIAFHVPFADYSPEELYQITALMAEKKNLKLSDSIREKLLPIYETAIKTDDFGNGRFARNVLEKAAMNQASRLVAMDVDRVTVNDIEQLSPDDFEVQAVKPQTKKIIGFAS